MGGRSGYYPPISTLSDMESSSLKIYDIQLVINSVDVEGVVGKVLCVECCGSRMFLGTGEGYLLEYFITGEKERTFFTRVRHSNINKSQPILQVRNASALDTLIALTGSTLLMCNNQTLETKGNSISGVLCFAVDENPMDGDPFSVSICLSKKKSIVMAQCSEKGFSAHREIALEGVTISLAIECGLCCAALATGKYIFVNTTSAKKNVYELCEFDPKEVAPKVLHVGKEEFLVIGPGGLGVFVTSRGTSERPPMIWPEKILQLVVDGFNVVAVGNDALYVSSLLDPGTSNFIPFPGAKCLSLSEGKLYVGTMRSLYRFIPISVDEQVEGLLSSDKIEQALGLLQVASLRQDKKDFLFKKIHKRAVFKRMAELDLSQCKESITLSSIDLREILSLFPKLLPSNTVFTRGLPQVHDYADINQMTEGDATKINRLASFLLDVIASSDLISESKDLSTAALKLAAKCNKGKYLRLCEELSSPNYEDCFEWFEEMKLWDCAAQLHKAKGDFRSALDIWMALLTHELEMAPEEDFQRIEEAIINCLLKSSDEHLVWSYYQKLAKVDGEAALQVFTKRPSSPLFQPLEIAQKLSSDPHICRVYLRHCVLEKGLEDEDLHTFLATLYIDQILATGLSPPSTEDLRIEFRSFLLDSTHLKVQYLIGKLSSTALRLELAILHGKAGDHGPALKIIIEELQDDQFAREYCKKIRDKEQRQAAFVDLFKTYLNSSSTSTQLNSECVSVLLDFVEEFDLSSVLSLLPDDLPLQDISTVIRRAVRLKIHKERETKVVKGLCERVHADYRIYMDSHNQGYQLDEESVCGVCWRKFDHLEPLLYNKGLVVHSKCV